MAGEGRAEGDRACGQRGGRPASSPMPHGEVKGENREQGAGQLHPPREAPGRLQQENPEHVGRRASEHLRLQQRTDARGQGEK